MSSVTSTGARPPGTRTAPMTRSASRTRARDRGPVARQRLDPALVDLVDPAQAVEVLVEQEHLGLHALRDPRRVPADVARAEHDDARGPHARRAAEQHARARPGAARGSARRSAVPCAPPPRSSARAAAADRCASWTVSYATPVVRDSIRARARLGIRGEVEVGEQDEARAAGTRDSDGLRLLDLDDEARRVPTRRRRVVDDLGAGGAVVVVGDARAARRRRARRAR